MKLSAYSYDLGLPAPILAIHGNMASSRWWEPMIQEIKSKKLTGSHPLIAADWLGCGSSPAPRSLDDLHPTFLAELYLNLLDDFAITEKTVIMGHSYGGLIAALATLKAPERFSHSFLINPATYRGLPVNDEKLAVFARMKTDRDFCAAVLATTIEGQSIEDPFFQKLVDDCFQVAELNWEGILLVLDRYRGEGQFQEIQVPTRMIHGTKDLVLPMEDARAQAALIPNCDLIELEGFGHSPNIEDPRKTTQLLFDFSEFSL